MSKVKATLLSQYDNAMLLLRNQNVALSIVHPKAKTSRSQRENKRNIGETKSDSGFTK